jgi:excisionase family DNA binding protein
LSLTSHLRDPKSPIKQFIRQHCSQSSRIARVANPQLRSAGTINPGFEPWVYSHLGMAIDYRIRYFFAITPKEHLTAWHGVPELAMMVNRPASGRFVFLDVGEAARRLGVDRGTLEQWVKDGHLKTHRGVGHEVFFRVADVEALYNKLHPTSELAEAVAADEDGSESEGTRGEAQDPYPLELLLSFFDRLDTTLRTIQPVGRRLNLEEERLLARYCFVLGLFEEPYRSGHYADRLLMKPRPRKSVDELLAIPEDAWVDDLCALSALFYDKYHHLFSLPFTLNPTFAGSSYIGGADADIIIDGQLIEIKSSIRARIDSTWLYQLIGYVLLDYDDHYHLHSVGIYMARQGLLLTWPLIDFLRLLTGNDQICLAQLRQEFRALCQPRLRRRRSVHRDKTRPRTAEEILREAHTPTAEEMQSLWGYSQERIQWTLKNQQITKTMRQEGYSENEIHQEIMASVTMQDLQNMGFPEKEIKILFPHSAH